MTSRIFVSCVWRPKENELRLSENLTLQVGLLIGRAFNHGEPPLTRYELTLRTGAPEEAIEFIVNALCHRQVLRETSDPPGLILTRPLEQITLVNMLEAIRDHDIALGDSDLSIDNAVEQLAAEVDGAIIGTLAARTLRDLVEAVAPAGIEQQRHGDEGE